MDEANNPHFLHLSGTSCDIQSIRNGSSGKESIKMDVESNQWKIMSLGKKLTVTFVTAKMGA